jgi:tetratricopeptide (TPR) repeat protein
VRRRRSAREPSTTTCAGCSKALGAYEASTKADPTRFAAWMKTGYAAQYLAGVDASKQAVAQAAYEKAIDLDGESQLPLKGLAALHRSKPEAWVEALTRLVKEKPKAPAVTYWWAYQLRSSGKADEAEKAYRAFAAASRFPALGWYEVGTLLAEKGDAAGAKKAFERSLELDPKHVRAGAAVDALVGTLNGRAQESVRDVVKAKALLKDYEALASLVPWSSGVRNDAGFFAREAFNETKDPAILQASVKWYVAASALLPEHREDLVETTPYPTRHGWAQILNDTGLMFHYYDATRDLAKAEAYYRKAMDWTQHGYWDAYGNLLKLLKAADRWQDAYDLASACADGIKKENGEPNESFRGTCRGEAEMLQKKLEAGK